MTVATLPVRRNGLNKVNQDPSITYKMPDLGQPWPEPIVYLPNTWGVSVAVIYPDLARLMLETNTSRQRRRKKSVIAKYASDMKKGLWTLTHQGISFNAQGELGDGQHRLEACIEAGVPFTTMVFFGVGDSREMEVFDTGEGRSPVDAAHVRGLESSRNRLSYLRRFLLGGQAKAEKYSHSYLLEQQEKYAPMLDFLAGLPSHRLLPAGIRAAIGRAWYYADPAKLNRFVAILTDHENANTPGERTVVSLRTSQISRQASQSFREGAEWFKRAQRSIQAYLSDQYVTRIYAVEEDIFPLPTDHQIKIAHDR